MKSVPKLSKKVFSPPILNSLLSNKALYLLRGSKKPFPRWRLSFLQVYQNFWSTNINLALLNKKNIIGLIIHNIGYKYASIYTICREMVLWWASFMLASGILHLVHDHKLDEVLAPKVQQSPCCWTGNSWITGPVFLVTRTMKVNKH